MKEPNLKTWQIAFLSFLLGIAITLIVMAIIDVCNEKIEERAMELAQQMHNNAERLKRRKWREETDSTLISQYQILDSLDSKIIEWEQKERKIKKLKLVK